MSSAQRTALRNVDDGLGSLELLGLPLKFVAATIRERGTALLGLTLIEGDYLHGSTCCCTFLLMLSTTGIPAVPSSDWGGEVLLLPNSSQPNQQAVRLIHKGGLINHSGTILLPREWQTDCLRYKCQFDCKYSVALVFFVVKERELRANGGEGDADSSRNRVEGPNVVLVKWQIY